MSAPKETMVSCLTRGHPPRVWSLLVTVFGELAQDRDAVIPGRVLSDLTDAIGIKPEANRVALHRLRKEGWIESQKDGRRSLYKLTPWGLAQSQKASPRIYGHHGRPDRAWLVISPSGQDEPGLRISPGVSVMSARPVDAAFFANEITATNPLPDWIKNRLVDEDLRQLSRQTATAFADFETLCRTRPPETALDRAVARVLIVHAWRRIALRQPNLPEHVFPKDWRGADCARLSHTFLQMIAKPELDEVSGVINAAQSV